MLYFVRYISVC